MKRNLMNLLAVFLFVVGFLMLAYPVIQSLIFKCENKQYISEFRKSVSEENVTRDAGMKGETEDLKTAVPYEKLLENMKTYNQKIYEEKQVELRDAWSYRKNIFDFASIGISDDMIGYITIDAMNVEIPLYIGASDENLRRGAAVLTQTSMPVGGQNTNCVIAAHRGGYYGDAMFRDIEVLQPGDKIQVSNFWETLEYEVVRAIVTVPDDIEAVKIIEGQDLVTLVTCHPYSDNYQRYIVYCRRVEQKGSKDKMSGENDKKVSSEAGAEALIGSEGIPYESSRSRILGERIVRIIGVIVFGIGVLILAIRWIFHRKKKKK